MKIFNGTVVDIGKLCLTFTITEELNPWIMDSGNTFFKINGRTELKEGIPSKEGLGFFRSIYITSNGETIYTNNSGYLTDNKDQFGQVKESTIFITPSKTCLSLKTVGRSYSGKFMVRVPPDVHRKLAVQAAESGVSLNRIASSKLSQ